MIAEHYLKKVGERIGRISHASTLLSATEALQERDVDVVLLDLTLPDSRIDETLDALTDLTRAHRARFVALSSLSTDDIARQALENGASAFLAKQDFSAATFLELLDELGFLAVDEEFSAPGGEDSALSRPTASHEGQAPEDILGPVSLGAGALASQIAHDAMGWASNVTFRTRAMEADPAIQASEELQAGLASIRASAAALTSFISGARSLLMTELELDAASAAETEEIPLSTWLPAATQRWQKRTRDKRLAIHVEATSSVQVPKESGARLLQQTMAALLHNAKQHAARADGLVTVTLREAASEGPDVLIDVIDDGGPWQLDGLAAMGTSLGSPLATGNKKSPSAGLGLFIASRTLLALGGALTTHERDDAPGAYAIRLSLPRCES